MRMAHYNFWLMDRKVLDSNLNNDLLLFYGVLSKFDSCNQFNRFRLLNLVWYYAVWLFIEEVILNVETILFPDFKSKEMRVRQRSVALYFIDKLALRAGNEKDEDQADTVGCCSLRCEHITLHEEHDGESFFNPAVNQSIIISVLFWSR